MRDRRAPAVDPIARPVMNDAAIVANAYVVGPMTSASRRVKATSKTSAVKPENAAAVHASVGSGSGTGDDGSRRGCFRPFLDFSGLTAGGTGSATSIVSRRESQSAPSPAVTLSATPIHVVPRRPRDGISQKPAPIAPAAAPAVLAA